MDFSKSMAVAASGMRAQTDRMKTIAENIANASSTSPVKGADPVSPQDRDHQAGFRPRADATLVSAGNPIPDKSDFAASTIPAIPMPTSRAM
jgi:flagellar basal-body rod protein FlgC